MSDLKTILDLCFNPDEEVVVSDSKWAYHSIPISSLVSGQITLVSPNPKVKNKTVTQEDLVLLAINPIKGYRNDEACTSFRTFLFEQDTGGLKQQLDHLKALRMPYTATIFSGNKSVHTLVTLDKDLDEKTYRNLYLWALNISSLFDQNCKNPSRSVRIPGVIRPDTGKKQRLLEIKDRVKVEDFLAWLNRWEHLKPQERVKKENLTNVANYDNVSKWAKKQLSVGIDFSKGRNKAFYALAMDLALSGLSEDDAIELLDRYYVEERDFKRKEWLTTISSAFKHAESKK